MAEPKLYRHPKIKTYYVHWQEDGRQRKKSLKTRNERKAKTRFNRFKADLRAKKIKPISKGARTRFFAYADEFLEYIAATKTAATYTLYSVAIDKARDCWSDIPINHITTRHIDLLLADMARAGLKPPTINKNFRHVKGALNKAYEWEYLDRPIRWPKPVAEESKTRYLTADQLRAVLGAISDPEFYDFALFAAYSGLRSGEIIRLKWSDTDNPPGFIRISPKQKNKTESRIPINKNLPGILDRCKARGGKKVFRFVDESYVSRQYRRAADSVGLNWSRLHDLRHTFGSTLAMAGERETSIQNLMRHKSKVSTDVYIRLSPDHLKDAADSVNYGPLPVPKFKRRKKKKIR